jgi:hypothetical protein
MPTRKIEASPVKVTGTAPDGQKFESSLEEDFFFLLRFNPDVESFESNTVTVHWIDAKGKHRIYTPDVLVHFKPDTEGSREPSVLCEVKIDLDPSGDLPKHHLPRNEDEEENKLKWAAAEIHANRNGWAWKVMRESEIRTTYLRNAKFLLRYLERNEGKFRKVELMAALAKHGELSLGDLVAQASSNEAERAKVYPTCYHLIGKRELHVDLASELISLESVVRLPK